MWPHVTQSKDAHSQNFIIYIYILKVAQDELQSNLRTTAMHGDEPFGLCREFDLISEFFGLDEDLVEDPNEK